MAILENAVRSGITNVAILGMLGAYLLDVGELEKAVSLLEALVEREPDYAEGHNYLGTAYGRLGRHADARRELERVLELDPSSAPAYNNLGSLALSQGRIDEAISYLERALAIDPFDATALNGIGLRPCPAGRHAEGDGVLAARDRERPEQFDALFNLAIALGQTSPREAAPYLDRFAREAPPQRYRSDIEKARALAPPDGVAQRIAVIPELAFPPRAFRFGTMLMAAGCLLSCRQGSDHRFAPRPTPNVLLVSIDTLRADHLGCYGAKAKTPTLDRLAATGVLFERALSHVPLTLPSHASLFTGIYPIAHGIRDNGAFRLAANAPHARIPLSRTRLSHRSLRRFVPARLALRSRSGFRGLRRRLRGRELV